MNDAITFGLTADVKSEMERLRQDKGEHPQVIKEENYDKLWQAELIEQVVRHRLMDMGLMNDDLGEWSSVIPAQVILNCYLQTRDRLQDDFRKHQHIHTRGSDRHHYYREIAQMYFHEGNE